MPDKIAVVTGATGGIGRYIALGLVRAGYHVVLVGRDQDRAAAAQSWIATQTVNAQSEIMIADLSSIAETKTLAQEISAKHPRIDILVNNAGIFSARHEITSEGHERVLATNHLSPFVLTIELEKALRAAGEARVVTIGSDMSDKAHIDPGNLELTRGWNFVRAYSRAKLAQMMTSFEMARRLAGSGATVNVVHPGAVATALVRTPGIIGFSWKVMAPFLLTEEQGADTPLYIAVSPDVAGQTGLYYKKRLPVAPNRLALDQELVSRIWAATEALL